MGILSFNQLHNGYFHDIGGFSGKGILTAVSEYDGSGVACIACTQLAGRYSDTESRRILGEWIAFLKDHPDEFRALHFNTKVPQALFDAACAQRNLTELRCKWGNYSNLSDLRNLTQLQYLYMGAGTAVRDLTPIPDMDSLSVLYLENFRRVEDYSPLARLSKLEQLVISGPSLGKITIEDLDFVCRMPRLRSLWLPNAVVRRNYTPAERDELFATGIQGVYDQEWWNL